jgi:hypothetical protein
MRATMSDDTPYIDKPIEWDRKKAEERRANYTDWWKRDSMMSIMMIQYELKLK